MEWARPFIITYQPLPPLSPSPSHTKFGDQGQARPTRSQMNTSPKIISLSSFYFSISLLFILLFVSSYLSLCVLLLLLLKQTNHSVPPPAHAHLRHPWTHNSPIISLTAAVEDLCLSRPKSGRRGGRGQLALHGGESGFLTVLTPSSVDAA